jgi:uncharacterized protein YbbC (DUF1343 family)
MPTPETALIYPGACMFEGTSLSEGRGTTRPFEVQYYISTQAELKANRL